MQIGFAGLGALGTPMAARLAATPGLAVWNRTRARADEFAVAHTGVRLAATPRELAIGADAIITCLPTSAEVTALLEGPDGLLAGLAAGAIVIDCTSGDPETSRAIATRLAEHGIAFVDAPVSGGPPMAAAGTLSVMCGGSAEEVARAKAIVAPFAGKVIHMGPVGAGHAMKAANNVLLAANLLALSEAMCIVAKAGIAPRAATEVLNVSSGRSFVSEVLFPERVLTGTFPPLFRLALLEKDAGIATDLAASLGVDAPTLTAAREAYRTLRATLGESADYMAPFQVAEAAAGITLRG